MIFLRQSTAATIAVGPFSAKVDGVTPVTTLTAASTLNGRALSNGVGAAYAPATFVHDANGYYLASLAAGDVPSVNRMLINFSDPATYAPVWHEITVYAPAVYDAQFGTVAANPFNLGVIAATPAPTTTTFSAAAAGSTLAAQGGAYLAAGSPNYVFFTSGVLAGQKFLISGHTLSTGVHAFTVGAMPAAPGTDSFYVI